MHGRSRVVFGWAPLGIENLAWKPWDGSGPPERLTSSALLHAPGSWSSDERTLAFVDEGDSVNTHDIWVLTIDGDKREPRPILRTPASERYPEFSPDGRWLAYVSNESGRDEVYVQPYPGPGGRLPVSTLGGTDVAWARDGRRLYYIESGANLAFKLMEATVTMQPALSIGTPHAILERRDRGGQALIRGYDVTADGQRFLMVKTKERPPIKPTEMVLVQNWLEELKRRVPTHQ